MVEGFKQGAAVGQLAKTIEAHRIQPLKDVAILSVLRDVAVLLDKTLNLLEARDDPLLARRPARFLLRLDLDAKLFEKRGFRTRGENVGCRPPFDLIRSDDGVRVLGDGDRSGQRKRQGCGGQCRRKNKLHERVRSEISLRSFSARPTQGKGRRARQSAQCSGRNHDFDGYLTKPGQVTGCDEIRMPPEALREAFGCNNLQLLTDDGGCSGFSFPRRGSHRQAMQRM